MIILIDCLLPVCMGVEIGGGSEVVTDPATGGLCNLGFLIQSKCLFGARPNKHLQQQAQKSNKLQLPIFLGKKSPS